jgi:ATP-binding cassette subfamily C (CFTR/MRP) protein 1
VILDEATSRSVQIFLLVSNRITTDIDGVYSVDRETDRLMQRIIKEEFANKTVIAIAHRLDTIIEFDKIAVFEKGALVEYDEPDKLLKKESTLKKLYTAS